MRMSIQLAFLCLIVVFAQRQRVPQAGGYYNPNQDPNQGQNQNQRAQTQNQNQNPNQNQPAADQRRDPHAAMRQNPTMAPRVSMDAAPEAQGQEFEKVEDFWLKAPFTATDNTRWETGAGARVDTDYVRLTPQQPGRTGYLWSRNPVHMTDWSVDLQFDILGPAQGGGEGMAFWFVEKKMLGPVFGSADYWNGIGIFFDTFNNNNAGSSPLIAAIYNDGTMAYGNNNDGEDQAVGACTVSIRNTDKPAWARITYARKLLSVDVAVAYNGDLPIYNRCLEVQLELGVDKYFGVTAHTGPKIANVPAEQQPADSHDIYSIMTYNMRPEMTEAEAEAARRSYYDEVETQHKQHKGYHEVGATEFRHQVLTSLKQVGDTVQMMDNSQMGVENMLTSVQGVMLELLDGMQALKTDNAQARQADPRARNANPAHDCVGIRTAVDNLHDQMKAVDNKVQQFETSHQAHNNGLTSRVLELATMISNLEGAQNRMSVSLENLSARYGNGGDQTQSNMLRDTLAKELSGMRTGQERLIKSLVGQVVTTLSSEVANDVQTKVVSSIREEGMNGSGGGGGWLMTLLMVATLLGVLTLVGLRCKPRDKDQNKVV